MASAVPLGSLSSSFVHPPRVPSPFFLRCHCPVALPRRSLLVRLAASDPSADKKARPGIQKICRVSPTLQKFVGSPMIARTQALKLTWDYIKKHNLQDPKNRKVIICDETLKVIFAGRDSVDFLEIARLLSAHFVK